MAISDDLPGFEITVEVDGKSLKEYEDSDEDDRNVYTVTRYIEAQTDKEFAIRLKADAGTKKFLGDYVSFEIYVDGTFADSPLVSKVDCGYSGCDGVSEGFQLSEEKTAKYKFALLETAQDSKILKDEISKVEGLGTIIIDAIHKKKAPTTSGGFTSTPKTFGIVSEKALKGQTLSHRVGTSGIVEEKVNWLDTEPVDPDDPIAATFEFKYRSLAALKSLCIIPRTPTPPPLEEKDELTPEEIKELQRQNKALKAQQANTIKIKRERTDENPRPRKAARPHGGDEMMEEDEHGNLRAVSTAGLGRKEKIVVEILDD